MQLYQILSALEQWAPLSYQESYDNAGLLLGHPDMEISKALICLDCTEVIVNEAIASGANLIIAHHPIIFSGLKKLNGKNYVERAVLLAIKNDIAIYAAHTNLDNVMAGVNSKLAEKLGLQKTQIMSPKNETLRKLVTFCPTDEAEQLRNALFEAGAGNIGNYDQCSFNLQGTGTFRANDKANPTVGIKGHLHHEPETRIEVIFESNFERDILQSLIKAHPYEEVAYDIYQLSNQYQKVGSGMVGWLPEPMDSKQFLAYVQQKLEVANIRHTAVTPGTIHKVAVCGGAGSFLLPKIKAIGAQAFISSDFKYHEFFEADGQFIIVDPGHYETERFTIDLFYDFFKQKFPTFAVLKTKNITNPVNYL